MEHGAKSWEQEAIVRKLEEKGIVKIVCVWFLMVFFFVAVPLIEAQPTVKLYRIGFLSGGFPGPTHWTAKLRTELQKIGYVEGIARWTAVEFALSRFGAGLKTLPDPGKGAGFTAAFDGRCQPR
jgi:hypothetical protein